MVVVTDMLEELKKINPLIYNLVRDTLAGKSDKGEPVMVNASVLVNTLNKLKFIKVDIDNLFETLQKELSKV